MDEANLHDHLAVLRRRRRVVVVSVLVAVGVALLAAIVQTPRYRAETELLLRRTDTQAILIDELGQIRSASDSQRELNNELRLIESQRVRDAVDERYDGPLDVTEVEAHAPSSDTDDEIEISLVSTDPAEAAQLVNLYTDTYITERRARQLEDLTTSSEQIQSRLDKLHAQIVDVSAPLDSIDAQADAAPLGSAERSRLEEQRRAVQRQVLPQLGPLLSRESSLRGQLTQLEVTKDLAGTGGVEVLAPAEEPDSPVSPNTVRYLAIAVLVGLVGGVALAWFLDYLDDSVRTKEEAEDLTGLPTLGIIPRVPDLKRESTDVVTVREPASLAAEAYRSLRTSVRFVGVDRSVSTILVTSAGTSEGKSMTAANLAVVLAQAGERVLLVDADLRQPRVHEFFDLPLRPGLTNLLLGDAEIGSAVRSPREPATLEILPAGPLPPNPAELLDGPRARQLLEVMAATRGTVVIDSPPLLPVTDAQVLARLTDATLLVVSYRETSKRALARSLELLGQVDAPVVGMVLNQVPIDQAYVGQNYGYAPYGRRAEASHGSPSGERERPVTGLQRSSTGRGGGNHDGERDGGPVPAKETPGDTD